MCLTGIQPLAMLRCRGVVAPVLCQPTLPFGRNETDLGLPPSDVDFALARVLDPMAKEPLEVLQIRYSGDRIASPRRADRLKEMFGSRMTLISLPGDDHSSLVHDPHETARKAVIDFLRAKLTRSQPPCVV
jgi:hypothetical protein